MKRWPKNELAFMEKCSQGAGAA